MAEKNSICLICDASMGVSTRKCCPIFEQQMSSSQRTIVAVISSILGLALTREDVHSNAICKKCFKVCDEIDELEDRLQELKLGITSNYQKTLQKHSKALPGELIVPDIVNEVLEQIPSSAKKKRGRPPKKIKTEEVDSDTVDLIQLLEGDDEGDGGGEPEKEKETTTVTLPETETVPETEKKLSTDLAMVDDEDDQDFDVNLEEELESDMEIKDTDIDEEYVPTKNNNKLPRKNASLKTKNTEEAYKKALLTIKKSGVDKLTKFSKPAEKKVIKKETEDSLIPQMVVNRDNGKYTCLLCTVGSTCVGDARSIIKHLKSIHEIRMYICDVCGVEFFKRKDLCKHLDNHVTPDGVSQQCTHCHRVFDNYKQYRSHVRMHKTSVGKNHTCYKCGKRFGSRNLLEEHNNTHTGQRPHCCTICGKGFTSKYTLKAHGKIHQDRPRPFTCINCGKGFLTQQNLIHHERIHSGIKSYVCQQCGKAFGTARNLETHFVTHTGYKPFICRLCGKAFSRKPEIRDHERTHTGEKPYVCEFCGASFSQRSNLQTHKRNTHYDDKRYKCTDCGRAFKRRRLLDYHMKAAHTGERPFKCEICEATFIYPEHFKKHKLIHTGAKPYECEVCGKAFNSRDNRNAHRFVHSDKKPYECLVCGMGFMRKPLLYNHMNTMGHQNDTIVVNQPRLTAEDEVTTTSKQVTVEDIPRPSSQQLGMTLITDEEGNQKLLPTSCALDLIDDEQRKMFIEEMKEHVIIQDVTEVQDHNLIVVDPQVQYATQEELDQAVNSVQVAEGVELNDDGTSATYQVDDGSIQIVQIRIDDDEDNDQKQWFDIIQATEEES